MGINRKASDDFAATFSAFVAANGTTRAQRRKYVAQMVNSGNEWLAKFDAQDNAAPSDFAASKKSQFDTFTATLADPALTPIDPSA